MDPTDLAFAGAARQAELIAAGEVSARELTELTLERIARIDPQLNAYRIVLGEQALAEADAADARRTKAYTATGRRRKGSDDPGILNGVPIAIKDDADMAGEVTACGSAAHGPAATVDGEVVRRLRAAGAVLVGKTNVPEMMAVPWTESLAYGATRNPWDVSRTAGGSSGGTASAVAAGLAGVGLGSDGGGSIRIPSSWTGLFGIKPTRDRVPLAPHDDAWQGMSVNGPLARHVADAALFLDATSTLPVPEGGFAAACAGDPSPLRIGVSTKLPPGVLAVKLDDARSRALDDTVTLLGELGHQVVERDPDYPAGLWPSAVVRILRGIHDDVEALMPHADRLEGRTRFLARLGGAIPEDAIRRVRAAEAGQLRRVTALFGEVDVLLTPLALTGPYRIGHTQNHGALRMFAEAPRRIAYAPAFNVTGQPACVVPSGFDADGLPVSVQLVAPPAQEQRLFALAGQLERARPWADRRPAVAS